jgi:signal transduction histidine kinase
MAVDRDSTPPSGAQPPENPNEDLWAIVEAWHDASRRSNSASFDANVGVERLGRAAIHAASEVQDRLACVSPYLTLLRRRLSDDAGSLDIVEKVEADLTAADAAVSDVLQLARDDEPRMAPVPLGPLLDEIHSALSGQMRRQGVRLSVDAPAHGVVTADREMLRRAVIDLELNALDAMPEGGELVVTVYCGHSAVDIEIADSGEGLSDENLARAGQLFHTTKNHGAGLGLAVVRRIAQAHQGRLRACNCPEGGAAFTLSLPRRAMEAAA